MIDEEAKIEIFDMPTAATEDTVHSIVANSVPGKLPVEFTVDGEKVISINTLKEEFKMLKFEPILVASGLTREEFDGLMDSFKETYGGLVIEQWNDKFYIVDFPSLRHGAYSGSFTQYWASSFASEFRDASRIFYWSSSPTVQGIEPDWSGWVETEYCYSEIDARRPFIVLEVAWSQSSENWADKIQ